MQVLARVRVDMDLSVEIPGDVSEMTLKEFRDVCEKRAHEEAATRVQGGYFLSTLRGYKILDVNDLAAEGK